MSDRCTCGPGDACSDCRDDPVCVVVTMCPGCQIQAGQIEGNTATPCTCLATSPATGDTLTDTDRQALLHAWPWPQEAATTRDGFSDVVAATEAIVARHVNTALRAAVALADESPRCWTFKSDDLLCGSVVGGTFDNGAAWVEEMCCLPCRLRTALTSPPTHPTEDGSSGRVPPSPR